MSGASGSAGEEPPGAQGEPARGADEGLAEELRRALALAGAAGTIAAPTSHARLLELIVETAAATIGARAGTLFLIDEAAQELTFEVAIGPKAAEVKKFRVPIGQSIAGLVAVSGQPMAVADAANDPRHAAEIARRVGYTPGTILAVPLVAEERIVGVLELLDKEGAAGFSPGDMGTLGQFARLAGVAIEQSAVQGRLGKLMGETLAGFGVEGGVARRAEAFAEAVEGSPVYRDAQELAGLVREIAAAGEAESSACRAILQGFADYLRARRAAQGWGLGLDDLGGAR